MKVESSKILPKMEYQVGDFLLSVRNSTSQTPMSYSIVNGNSTDLSSILAFAIKGLYSNTFLKEDLDKCYLLAWSIEEFTDLGETKYKPVLTVYSFNKGVSFTDGEFSIERASSLPKAMKFSVIESDITSVWSGLAPGTSSESYNATISWISNYLLCINNMLYQISIDDNDDNWFLSKWDLTTQVGVRLPNYQLLLAKHPTSQQQFKPLSFFQLGTNIILTYGETTLDGSDLKAGTTKVLVVKNFEASAQVKTPFIFAVNTKKKPNSNTPETATIDIDAVMSNLCSMKISADGNYVATHNYFYSFLVAETGFEPVTLWL